MDGNTLIIAFTSLNIMFLWIHELDACRWGEWRMFKFLGKLTENTQYRIFLLLHIPFFLFSLYYFWTVFQSNNFVLWVIWNVLMIAHLLIHIVARSWRSNVFKSSFSFFFIYGTAITAFINLLLYEYY